MESGCLLALGCWMRGIGSPGTGVPSFPDDGGTKIGPGSLNPVGHSDCWERPSPCPSGWWGAELKLTSSGGSCGQPSPGEGDCGVCVSPCQRFSLHLDWGGSPLESYSPNGDTDPSLSSPQPQSQPDAVQKNCFKLKGGA